MTNYQILPLVIERSMENGVNRIRCIATDGDSVYTCGWSLNFRITGSESMTYVNGSKIEAALQHLREEHNR